MSGNKRRATRDSKRDVAVIGWQKSTHCQNAQCVEVSLNADGDILMRRSEEPARVLVVTQSGWRDLLQALKNDDLRPAR